MQKRGHTVHETRHLCWLQWGQNKRCYFYVRIDHTIEVQGALQKSRDQPETGPCLLLGAADVRRSTYSKGCSSKFYAFSGFMNPRLSAALLCCPPTAPSLPIQNKNLEGLRMRWPGQVGITHYGTAYCGHVRRYLAHTGAPVLTLFSGTLQRGSNSLLLVPPYPGWVPPSFFPFVSCSIFLLYRSIVRQCKSKWALLP